MDYIALQTLLIAVIVGISCGLLGTFLVLRKMSMMVDAISHTVLLGIVLAYMVVKDLGSPLLMIGSTIMGVLTVILIEILVSTKRTTEDAATGAIFPFLFSLAVILITTRFKNTHLDTHAISGNLEFAAYEQLSVFGVQVISKTLFINIVVLLLILIIIGPLFKEFKISSFDRALAKTLGLMPLVLQYILMTIVSLTAVTSFNAVGSILVIAMMIGPATTSLLLTKNLKDALIVSAIVASFNAIVGYGLAMFIFKGGVNISSTIASVTLITFLVVWFLEPKKGLVARILRKAKQKEEFELLAILIHVYMHRGTKDENKELNKNTIFKELNWPKEKYEKSLQKGISQGYLSIVNDILCMTDEGEKYYEFKMNALSSGV